MKLERMTLPGMSPSQVRSVLAGLRGAGCRVWLSGGWGVDALVGRHTRAHRDVDLAVDAADEARAIAVLVEDGYRIETDRRPVRVELAAPGRRWVDLHPVVFGPDGSGVQAGPSGSSFSYPVSCFVTGTIDGAPVPCLSAAQQLAFHRGYPPRAVDRHDLALLAGLGPAGR